MSLTVPTVDCRREFSAHCSIKLAAVFVSSEYLLSAKAPGGKKRDFETLYKVRGEQSEDEASDRTN